MNLIYMCVFFQSNYLKLLELLLFSVKLKGNIKTNNTHILVFTSESFKDEAEKISKRLGLKVDFCILNINDLMESSCCKLKIFDYVHVDTYEKILYLDTDVLINGDLNILFNVDISDDKIYALEEGIIGDELWAGSTFLDLSVYDRNTPAFSAGVFYFRNSDCMKRLFEKTNTDIRNRTYNPVCLDQPFLVSNCIKENKYDNQLMKTYLENNPSQVDKSKLIYHFPGGPGHYASKFHKMINFLQLIKNIKEFDTRNNMIVHYASKIKNPKILEIGIFKGEFFDFIFRNCNVGSIDGVDIFEGETCSGDVDGNNVTTCNVGNCFLELSEKYKDHNNVRLIKSDSSAFLKNVEDNFYDIIYIDGDHSYEGVKKDILQAFHKIKNGGYIMGHDYEMNMNKAHNYYNFGVKQAVDGFCRDFGQKIIAKALDGCVSFCIKINNENI